MLFLTLSLSLGQIWWGFKELSCVEHAIILGGNTPPQQAIVTNSEASQFSFSAIQLDKI